MFADDESTVNDSQILPNEFYEVPHTMVEFKTNLLSGNYRKHDAITNTLLIEGRYQGGEPTGRWTYYNQDGDKAIFDHISERVGAVCRDGSRSAATGRGACSWHGGVERWVYETKRKFVSGTGIFEPLDTRHQKMRQEAIKTLKIKRSNNAKQEQWLLYKQAIKKFNAAQQAQGIIEDLQNENQELLAKVQTEESLKTAALSKIEQLQLENKRLREVNKQKFDTEEKIQQKQEKGNQEEDQQLRESIRLFEALNIQSQKQQVEMTQEIRQATLETKTLLTEPIKYPEFDQDENQQEKPKTIKNDNNNKQKVDLQVNIKNISSDQNNDEQQKIVRTNPPAVQESDDELEQSESDDDESEQNNLESDGDKGNDGLFKPDVQDDDLDLDEQDSEEDNSEAERQQKQYEISRKIQLSVIMEALMKHHDDQ